MGAPLFTVSFYFLALDTQILTLVLQLPPAFSAVTGGAGVRPRSGRLDHGGSECSADTARRV